MSKPKIPDVRLVGVDGNPDAAKKLDPLDPLLRSPDLVFYQGPDGVMYAVKAGGLAEQTVASYFQRQSLDPGSTSATRFPGLNADAPGEYHNPLGVYLNKPEQQAKIAAQPTPITDTAGNTTGHVVTTQNADGTQTQSIQPVQNQAGQPFGTGTTTESDFITATPGGGQFPTFNVNVDQYSNSMANYGPDEPRRAIRVHGEQAASSTDLLHGLYSMDPGTLQDLQQRLTNAGYVSTPLLPGQVTDAMLSAYKNLLTDTKRAQQGGQDITPDGLLAQRQKAVSAAQASGAGSATTTVTKTDVSNPLTAQKVISDAFAQHGMGKPNAKQLAAFTTALQAAQQANPTVTTDTIANTGGKPTSGSVKTVHAGTQQTQDSTTTQGINSSAAFSGDPAQFAKNYFENTYGPEANAVGVATGFYDAALKAIGAGGR